MTLNTNKGVIIWPRRALRASCGARDWRGGGTGGRACLLFVRPLSRRVPFDRAEEEILKYLCAALLPAAEVHPLCWERKSKRAEGQGWPAAPVALLSHPPTASYQGKQRRGANVNPPTPIPAACAGRRRLHPCIMGLLRPLCSCEPEISSSRPKHRLKKWWGSRWCWARFSSADNRLICIQNSGGLSPFGVRKHSGYRLLLPATRWVLYCLGPTG